MDQTLPMLLYSPSCGTGSSSSNVSVLQVIECLSIRLASCRYHVLASTRHCGMHLLDKKGDVTIAGKSTTTTSRMIHHSTFTTYAILSYFFLSYSFIFSYDRHRRKILQLFPIPVCIVVFWIHGYPIHQ